MELIWLRTMLTEMKIECSTPIVIYEDNQSCIHLLKKWEHRRLKHIDIKYNFIRDLYNNQELDVKFIPTSEQKADILTEGLAAVQFQKLCSSLGVSSP